MFFMLIRAFQHCCIAGTRPCFFIYFYKMVNEFVKFLFHRYNNSTRYLPYRYQLFFLLLLMSCYLICLWKMFIRRYYWNKLKNFRIRIRLKNTGMWIHKSYLHAFKFLKVLVFSMMIKSSLQQTVPYRGNVASWVKSAIFFSFGVLISVR